MEKYLGKYRATVVKNFDHEKRGRIKVSCPKVLGDVVSNWCSPCFSMSGKGHGMWHLPKVGDTVWIEFEEGNPNKPIWVGGWYLADSTPSYSGDVPTGDWDSQPKGSLAKQLRAREVMGELGSADARGFKLRDYHKSAPLLPTSALDGWEYDYFEYKNDLGGWYFKQDYPVPRYTYLGEMYPFYYKEYKQTFLDFGYTLGRFGAVQDQNDWAFGQNEVGKLMHREYNQDRGVEGKIHEHESEVTTDNVGSLKQKYHTNSGTSYTELLSTWLQTDNSALELKTTVTKGNLEKLLSMYQSSNFELRGFVPDQTISPYTEMELRKVGAGRLYGYSNTETDIGITKLEENGDGFEIITDGNADTKTVTMSLGGAEVQGTQTSTSTTLEMALGGASVKQVVSGGATTMTLTLGGAILKIDNDGKLTISATSVDINSDNNINIDGNNVNISASNDIVLSARDIYLN